MSYAEIKNINGQPTIVVNNEPFAPMAMTTHTDKSEYIHALKEAGFRIFFLICNTNWLTPGKKWQDENGDWHEELSGIDQFKVEAERLLKQIPDAYIFVRILLHPPVDWMNEHPDELMKYNDGSFKEAILAAESYRAVVPAMYSLCSEEWRKDAGQALQEFCNEIDALPFSDRIIGYFLAAGGTSEWYPVNRLEEWNEGLYGDFSPSFRKEYGKYLKSVYKDEETLQRIFKDKTVTFDNPPIPDLEKRAYTRIDDKILDAMKNYERADRTIGKKLELNPEGSGNLGVFLNADLHPEVAEFYHAWHHGTANSIIYFARLIKERDKGKLVGAFYGSYGCSDYYKSGTAEAVLPILDCGFVDFLAAPGVYNNREPGGYLAQREMQDSFRIRNQIFISEDDSRTHLENDFFRDAMMIYDVHDSIVTLKRDFARNLCEETFAWWFDQHKKGGRYNDPEILKLFRRQQEIAKKSLSFKREKKNEIALIYDQESLHYVSIRTNQMILDYYRTSDLGRIGAPCDYYFHDDMSNPEMPDYKVYIMINTYCLSDRDREVIMKKASRNHATVIWCYAPGFINPYKDKKMDLNYIRELTGFNTKMLDKTLSPKFRIVKDHPALKYGSQDIHYGYIDRDVHSNIWRASILTPPFANPCFFIDDDEAEILGRYLINNKPCLAMKEYHGFTSVYCCAQVLRSDLIASLAEYSGCHIYNHSDDCLYANENFVCVHARNTGKRTIYFKKPCDPFEVYERKFYGHHVTRIEVDMNLGDTLMFCISEQMPEEGI